MGNITMRQVIVDARGHESIVTRDDGGNSICERIGSRVRSSPRRMRRAVPLWFAATLAGLWLADSSGGGARAQSNGVAGSSLQLAQAKTSPAGHAGPARDQPQSADALARELATARKDIEALQGLLAKERENSAQVVNALQAEAEKLRKSLKDVPQDGAADLQKSLGQERERAARLEQDLAAARRDIEAQSAAAAKASDESTRLRLASEAAAAELRRSMQKERERGDALAQDLSAARSKVYVYESQAAKAGIEAARLKAASRTGAVDLQKSLGQERERAARLEQDLAAARRNVEAQAALATKASDEAARLREASQSSASDLQKSLGQEHERAAQLEQDLAAARRNVETQTALAAKASDEAARLKKVSENGADLQKSLAQEHERAARLEQDLAAARGNVETQTALAAKASDEAARLKKASENGADLQKSLAQEHERAARLEQNLAAARRDVETQTALAAKANDEAARLKKVSESGAGLQKSLGQERERATRLEKDLAAARSDVETQAKLTAKASDEAARLKKASESGAADLQKSLGQEHERAARLEKDLAAARRDVETQTALAAKAGDEAARLKAASQSGATDLQKLLAQEHERAAGLEQDLAAARRDVETQTALAAKAGDEAARLKAASQSGATDLQKSLAQEHERAAGLEKDLAAARRDVETQTALAAKAGDEAARLKAASQSGAADLQKSLAQEHERAAGLEKDLAAARRDVETQTALAAKAGDEAAQLKASQSGAADLQKSLAEEHERAARLELDLAAARRDTEVQSAATAKASDELAKLRLATEADAAEQRQSIQKEHERADAMAQDLATARSKVYAYEAQAAKANDEAAPHQQPESSDIAELRQSLQREQQRAEQLARDLATKSSELDAQAERAAAANAQAAGAQQAAEQAVAEQRSLLEKEHGRAEQLERDLASARRDVGALAEKVPPVASQVATTGNAGKSMQDEPAGAAVGSIEGRAAAPRPAGNVEAASDDGAQEARLMARARLLLERGDIGGARIVLERVAETGSAQASFALAETYDPLTLSNWGTYATRGDAAKARDLYAKAAAGGIKEAKARFEALR
ncbi:hypothetical protein CK489_06655 [Bradyrhizobium sp. UFLA03-84]|uniref:hypothetical protein n=1 Tax=Bradyrhizobium sp. UFLA03-84 TaxID=418599 RepID=UPI000BAE69E4|nr:hypothetical protein [Bradyrhizobium sp. UFLA03-84]PAY10214.1 hypothetical protein CK489_06655 [Bradyrhizobium sp. UFLA03-84]